MTEQRRPLLFYQNDLFAITMVDQYGNGIMHFENLMALIIIQNMQFAVLVPDSSAANAKKRLRILLVSFHVYFPFYIWFRIY